VLRIADDGAVHVSGCIFARSPSAVSRFGDRNGDIKAMRE